jgi:predicted secreted hydrolase
VNKYILALVVFVVIISGLLVSHQDDPISTSGMSIQQLLAGDNNQGFSRAIATKDFQFPKDHGPHPDYRNEWWYLTGNLEDENKNRFSYQLTFFRRALTVSNSTENGWLDSNIYMAHFALSNHQTGEFIAREKFGRNGAGVAGAQSMPFHVWLDDWEIISTNTSGNIFPLTLRAKNEHYVLDLLLNPRKPLVLQGDKGLSQKSYESGNASYYYSFTRLDSRGTLIHNNNAKHLKGNSWLDREWSTSALSKQQQGWDWFSLQLDDGRDVMFYQLREKNGNSSPFSSGVLVDVEGGTLTLDNQHVTLTPVEYWQYKQSSYPIKWQLQIRHPQFQRDWIISAPIQNQHLKLSVSYWEGAIDVIDQATNTNLGHGFLEMTGYE